MRATYTLSELRRIAESRENLELAKLLDSLSREVPAYWTVNVDIAALLPPPTRHWKRWLRVYPGETPR